MNRNEVNVQKYKGVIVVEAHHYYVDFFKGRRAQKKYEVAFSVGNHEIGMDFVDNLERLGHKVEVDDMTGEDEQDQA